MNLEESKIAIIGLGYVGLPLAVAFAKKYKVIGFDTNSKRINELQKGNDNTREINKDLLDSVLDNKNIKSIGLNLTVSDSLLKSCNIFIITVPTPIDKKKKPDLSMMLKASETVASFLKKNDIVIYESTVYPGATEEKMVPLLEAKSGLEYNKDFYCGYSPERINPGDKEHTITKILKVTSGSTPQIAVEVDNLYKSIITAGTFMASSIKVAEAAKVIENSQRDINIAFVNEISKIFNLIGIDTLEVLQAAGTKWNFLNFKPGLVGGHCIGVDPYYLAQKANELGYDPKIILSGRRLNDSMGKHIAKHVIKLMHQKNIKVIDSNVLLLGFTFKENCPDVRNTRVIDIYDELNSFDINVDVYDPWVNTLEVKNEYGIDILNHQPDMSKYSAIILAVAHQNFNKINIKSSKNQVVYDVKGVLPKQNVDARL
jgi:UDP-N-acetyl-D-glucosamine/UDP-N-acetyl-D-galactosamine dehydrogenase